MEGVAAMSDSAEGSPVVEIALEDTFQYHPVNTQIHKPFLIARLMENPAAIDNSLEYHIYLQDIGRPGTRSMRVKWTWTDDMIPPTPLAAQREYSTEAAAYALAFAAVKRLTPAELFDTADRNERFDYVLSEGGSLCGIEISGSQTEDRQTLRDRHLQKIRQLLDNPMRWGGYVAVVGFTRCEMLLSYHAGERGVRR